MIAVPRTLEQQESIRGSELSHKQIGMEQHARPFLINHEPDKAIDVFQLLVDDGHTSKSLSKRHSSSRQEF